MGMKIITENIGPLKGRFYLDLNSPVTVLAGDTGTGKSFLLRILQLLISELAESLDVSRLEDKLCEEFGSIESIISTGEEEGRVTLEYNGETIADVLHHRLLGDGSSAHGKQITVNKWRGGIAPYSDLAKRSIIIPDARIAIARMVMEEGHVSRLSPSEGIYAEFLCSLRNNNDWSLNESLEALRREGVLLKAGRSCFNKGIIEGLDSRVQSGAVFAFLSLAPAIKILHEGRAFLVAVDTIETQITPFLQGVIAVNLARWAKMGWKNKESPAPLLLVTHSSTVLAALSKEIEEGVDDRAVYVKERVEKSDVRTVVLYREDGEVKWGISEGIAMPAYLREYIRLI